MPPSWGTESVLYVWYYLIITGIHWSGFTAEYTFLKYLKKKSLVWSHYPPSHILLWIYFSLTTSTTVSTIKIKTRSFSIQLLRKASWLANTSSSKSVIQIKLNAPIDIDMLEKLFSFSLLKLESIVLAYRDDFFFISIAIDSLFQ